MHLRVDWRLGDTSVVSSCSSAVAVVGLLEAFPAAGAVTAAGAVGVLGASAVAVAAGLSTGLTVAHGGSFVSGWRGGVLAAGCIGVRAE